MQNGNGTGPIDGRDEGGFVCDIALVLLIVLYSTYLCVRVRPRLMTGNGPTMSKFRTMLCYSDAPLLLSSSARVIGDISRC